ncbi:ribosomal protein L7Ae [Oesophagostomum dentatum]|uniref:40S ribosomal protein S12 n=1 Tax=Oesophagostomum dentatum TaxID=61180 RepID=A0A0B1SY31_OESDE|nr:ribosomal protein L7Ae [Oesophagostomum dentatum]
MADAGGGKFAIIFRDEVKIPSAAAPAVMDVQGALKAVLRSASFADGLAKGLHEAAKALDKRQSISGNLLKGVFSNCDEPMYVKLVEALCNEHNIPLIKVADKKIIGEWCGLCKYDKEGKARKVVGCSCAVVKDYGNEELGKQVLQQYFDSKK